MRRKVIDNILLILIVFGMLALASFGLFLLTKDSAYAVDINNQNNQTNNPNVIFDAGFETSSGSALTHSIVSDINPEYKYLRLHIGMNSGCTLINPQVQFYDSANTSDINFDLGFGNMTSPYIKTSNDSNKTITFNDLTSGLNLGCQMGANFGNSVKVSKLNETSKVVFTATCKDSSGNTAPVYKEIYFNVGWTANLTMDVYQRLKEFNHVASTDEMIVKTEVTAKINYAGKHNILPVKQTELVIEVPTYKGIAPTSVSVDAVKTLATNGKDESSVSFNSSNYSYNSSTGKLTITVQNPNTGSAIPSVRGSDEYIVTYTFPKAAYDVLDTNGVSIVNKVDGTMTLYSNTSTSNITGSLNNTITLTTFTSDNSTGDLHKSLLYFNTLKNQWSKDREYSYILTHEITEMGSGTSTEKTEFGQVQFVTNSTTHNSYTSGKNYVPITKLEFAVSNFNAYLGSSGSIQVYADGALIGTINSSSQTTSRNGESCYSIDIPTNNQQSAEKISFINSAPLAEHISLKTYVTRSISKDLPYTISQIQEFKKSTELVTFYTAKTSSPTVYESGKTLNWENIADDTYSNASLNVITPNLKAQAGEQELELDIVLDNKQINTDIWTTPSFDIVLPEYIKAVNDTINIGVNVQNSVSMGANFHKKQLNGQWHILLPFTGTQQALFDPQTIIKVKLKVTVDKYAPNIEKDIKLYYINTTACKYLNNSTWPLTPATTGQTNVTFPILANNTPCAVADGKINFVTNPTLLCISELTNYNGSDSINSIDNNGATAPIGTTAITPKMNLMVQNNHTVPVSDIKIIGRIPYTNNKSAISNTDLGTNINTTLTSQITLVDSDISASDITIYYSDNLNATADLSTSSNNWTTSPSSLSTVKSYMIIVNRALAAGEQAKFSYNFSVPANLGYSKTLFANFGTTYSANGTTNSSETGKIGLATGQGASLSATKTASTPNGASVKEGDIITYTITVNNTSNVKATNVTIKDNIPEHTTYVEKNGSTYTPDSTKREITKNIGTLEANANYRYTFYVVVGKIESNTTIENTALITADGLEPISTNASTVSAVTSTPNLSVVKTSNISNGSTVKEGDKITYKITVTNNGNLPVKNVVIKDTVPENTIYYDTTTNTTIPSRLSVASAPKDSLEPGKSYSFEFTVVVGRITANTTIRNTAKVSSDGLPDASSNTNEITANTTVSNLSAEKTCSIASGSKVKEGDLIIYTITVRNNGTSPAHNISIKDTVPQYTTLYENNQRVPTKRDVGKTILNLNAGESDSYSFTVIVDEIPENTVIKNTGKVTGENVPDLPTNTVEISAEPSFPTLRLEKTSSIMPGSTISAGDVITYTITVFNDGETNAHNVVISDNVPEHTIYAENLGSQYRKDPSKTSISKTIETLLPGESESLTFSVIVDTLSANTVITNTARINANNSPEITSNTVGITAKPKVNTSGGNLPFAGHYSIIIGLTIVTLSIGGFTFYHYKKRRSTR